ncbi:hypothetical protein COO60DRAFT_1497661 [Scenedesmus sp. NREL 46B-D3]|nr:hypothetical protein COO60DRAFT_1497661 [Scenedesmus sp. NREL 46B-D3]
MSAAAPTEAAAPAPGFAGQLADPMGAAAAADWPGSDKFVAVQDLLDRNAVLVTQINDNHSVRTPEALTCNVLLIKELNSNVQRIVDIYQDLADVLSCSKQPEQQQQQQQQLPQQDSAEAAALQHAGAKG